jgi:hypothetical protein
MDPQSPMAIRLFEAPSSEDGLYTVPRTLVNVQRELSVALQHKTRDMLKIGSLTALTKRSEPENLLMKARQDTARFCCGV